MRFNITVQDPTNTKPDPLWLKVRYAQLRKIASEVNLLAPLELPKRSFRIPVMNVFVSKKTEMDFSDPIIEEVTVQTFIEPGSEHDATVPAKPSRKYLFFREEMPIVVDEEVLHGRKEFKSDRQALDDLFNHVDTGLVNIARVLADRLSAFSDLRKVLQRKT